MDFIKELVNNNILNDELIIKAYATNNASLITNRIFEKTGSYEILDRFKDANTFNIKESFTK